MLFVLLIPSCVAPVKMDLAQQSEFSKRDLGVSNIYNANRCRYLRALVGNAGEWYGGFCFMSKNTVYLRMIDSTNPSNGRYIKIPKHEMKSYSVYSEKYGSQLQIRADEYIYGVVVTDDLGKVFNDGTMTYANEIGSWGVPLLDSASQIPVKQAPVQPATVIPIIVYTK